MPIAGIAGTGTAQYFTDGSGNPVLFRGDTAWGLLLQAGAAGGAVTWQTDIDNYTSIRAAQGFNAVQLAAPGNQHFSNGATNVNGATWDGVLPFTSPGVLNDTYWQRLDYLLASAAAQGITVIPNVAPTLCLDTAGGPLNGWSVPNFTAFGTALGNRYAAASNLLWMFGDDSNGFNDPNYAAIVAGLAATADTHMVSVENYFESTSRFDLAGGGGYTFGPASASFQWCYSYNVGYDAIETAYGESSPLLVLHGDGPYDGEGNITQTMRTYMRNLLWWCLSSGSRGFMYGRVAIWPWPTTALAALTTNTFDNSDLKNALNAFGALSGWNRLVPDTGSALVTAGRGTHASHISAGSNYSGGTPNTYVSAAITAARDLAVIYLPNAGSAITVNGALMAAGYAAKWIDPVSGATSVATVGPTYSHAGANSAGGTDWVLALYAPPYATWSVP
jgi:hypothetical protein